MIKLCEVFKSYETKVRNIDVLKNISYSFNDHGFYAIYGESGSGKSTLLNILSLQDNNFKGNLYLDNIDIKNLNDSELCSLKSEHFSVVYQDLNLIEDFSVLENITIGLEMKDENYSIDEVISTLNKLGLDESILKEKTKNLSGGQKQRIAIARAIIKKSKVLICDEPTGSLDDKNAEEVMKILKELSSTILVIVASHSVSLVNKYADEIINIEFGTIKNNLIDYPIENLNYNSSKVKMPFKFILKMSVISFKKWLKKIIFVSLSFIISLSVLFITANIVFFNKNDAINDAIKNYDLSYYSINYKDHNPLNEEDISILEDTIKPLNCILTTTSNNIMQSYDINKINEGVKYGNCKGVINLKDNELSLLDYSIKGRLPSNEDDFKEVALTANFLISLGWINDYNDEDSINQILNNKQYIINFSGEQIKYNIVGIIDTKSKIINDGAAYKNVIDTYQYFYEMNNYLFVNENDFNTVSEKLYEEVNVINNDNKKLYSYTTFVYGENFYDLKDEVTLKFINNGIDVESICLIDFIDDTYSNMIEVYSPIFYGFSIIFLIISLLLLLNFIRSAYDSNKTSLNILRTLGMKKSEILYLYNIQSSFIIIATFLVAYFIYLILNYLLNLYISNLFSIHLTPLMVNYIILISLFFILEIVINLFTFIFTMKKINK